MPELPEVETVKRILEPQLAGMKIVSAKVLHIQIIAYPEADSFLEFINGQVIKQMSRRGKFLAIHFENGDSLVVHLRMTGQLLVTPADFPEEKHTHFVADLSNGKQIRYIDTRRAANEGQVVLQF